MAGCWWAKAKGLAKGRRAMAFAGLLVVALVVDHKGRIAAPPVVLGEGMPEPVEEAVLKAVEETLDKNKRSDIDDLSENVRRAARRAAQDAWGKKPITRVLVSETMSQFLHYVVLFSAYAVLWFLCLFCLLPIGLGSERDPDSGAPLNPMLKKKALIASVDRGGNLGRPSTPPSAFTGWNFRQRSHCRGDLLRRQAIHEAIHFSRHIVCVAAKNEMAGMRDADEARFRVGFFDGVDLLCFARMSCR